MLFLETDTMSEMPVHSCRPPLSSLPESYKAYNVGKEQAMSHALPIRRRCCLSFHNASHDQRSVSWRWLSPVSIYVFASDTSRIHLNHSSIAQLHRSSFALLFSAQPRNAGPSSTLHHTADFQKTAAIGSVAGAYQVRRPVYPGRKFLWAIRQDVELLSVVVRLSKPTPSSSLSKYS